MEEEEDDCDIPISVVVKAMTDQNVRSGFEVGENGAIVSSRAAEEFEADVDVEELGRGKRTRRPNTLYSAGCFWRHNDDSDEE